MIKVIENFIDKNSQDYIEKYVFDSKFPYRLHKIHNYGDLQESPLQFTHHLYMHEEGASPHFEVIKPIFGSLLSIHSNLALVRAKVNITTPYPPYDRFHTQQPHVDLEHESGESIDHMVCIYYINDSDGPTVFFNGDGTIDQIDPKKGQAVIFNGNTIHAGSNPINNQFRAIVNIDFILE